MLFLGLLAALNHRLEVEEQEVVEDVLPQLLLELHEEHLCRLARTLKDPVEDFFKTCLEEAFLDEHVGDLSQVSASDLRVGIVGNRQELFQNVTAFQL